MNKKIKEVSAIVGLDAGNKSIKLISNIIGKDQIVDDFYDNVYCESYNVKLNYDLKRGAMVEKENRPIRYKNYLDVSVTRNNALKPDKFIFGKQAVDSGVTLKERVNNYKTDDPMLVSNSLVCIVNTLLKQLDEKSIQDEMVFTIYLAAGLPYHEFIDGGRDKKYKESFQGTHIIEFNNPKYPIKKATVVIENLSIDIEGLAALYDNDKVDALIESQDRKLGEKRIFMVDIGCYTTDIIAGKFEYDKSENLLEFMEDTVYCKGFTQGVGNALDPTVLALKEKYADVLGQNGTITRRDIDDAVENEGIIEGTDFEIEPYHTQNCITFANELSDYFTNIIILSAGQIKQKINKIYIAGGGAKKPQITETFINKVSEKLGISTSSFELIKEPVFANARGYFGLAYAIYENLKEDNE